MAAGGPGFACEFWAPVHVLLVAGCARVVMALAGFAAGPQEVALTAGLCWALWGGALLSGRGRMVGRLAGWSLCLVAVVAVAAVVRPERMLLAVLEPVVLLWAGVVYAGVLGEWWVPVLAGVPVAAAAVLHAVVDVAGAEATVPLRLLCGPLAPLFSGEGEVTAAVFLYGAPAAMLLLPWRRAQSPGPERAMRK